MRTCVSLYLWISVRCLQRWNDPLLIWNSSDYGGVSTLRVPSSRVWIPDIVLYNRWARGLGPRYGRPQQVGPGLGPRYDPVQQVGLGSGFPIIMVPYNRWVRGPGPRYRSSTGWSDIVTSECITHRKQYWSANFGAQSI